MYTYIRTYARTHARTHALLTPLSPLSQATLASCSWWAARTLCAVSLVSRWRLRRWPSAKNLIGPQMISTYMWWRGASTRSSTCRRRMWWRNGRWRYKLLRTSSCLRVTTVCSLSFEVMNVRNLLFWTMTVRSSHHILQNFLGSIPWGNAMFTFWVKW